MGTRPRRYAVLLASAALSTGLLLTGCSGDPQPSPPPTTDGTVAAGRQTTTPLPATSDPDPTTASDPTTTADPTTSSPKTTHKGDGDGSPEEAGAPGVPKPARQHTLKGAEAFVRYFHKQLNVAWSKPEAGLISPLSTSRCESCAAYEAQAKKGMRTGRHLDGPQSTILVVEVTPSAKPQVVLASIKEQVHTRKVLDRHGKVVGHRKGQVFYTQAKVLWTKHGWQIQGIEGLKQ